MNIILIGDDSGVKMPIVKLAQNIGGAVVIGRIKYSVNFVSLVRVSDVNVIVVDMSGAGMKGLNAIYRRRMGMQELGIVAASSTILTNLNHSAKACGIDLFLYMSALASYFSSGTGRLCTARTFARNRFEDKVITQKNCGHDDYLFLAKNGTAFTTHHDARNHRITY